MQILKRHASAIFLGRKSDGSPSLNKEQRYQFLGGWMPWFADGFALIFAVLALAWSGLMIIAPRHFDVPLTALSALALAIFTAKTVKTVCSASRQGRHRSSAVRWPRRSPDCRCPTR